MSASARTLIPVTLLTGFLGSGKTTLLRRLLAHHTLADSAVLINEIGAVGIDHHLVREVQENAVVLANGCLCCTVRGDLVNALRELLFGRGRKGIARFPRVFIETTGLADPAPVAQALIRDPFVMQHYRLDGIVTVVDAVFGFKQLDRNRESVRQVAIADRIVISKTDLADAEQCAALAARLQALNPAARQITAVSGDLDPSAILDGGLVQALQKPEYATQWLGTDRYLSGYLPASGAATGILTHAIHDDRVRSFVVRFAMPLNMELLHTALEVLLAGCGDRLLRIKGLLEIEGESRPMVLHAVQHVMYPMLRLESWPERERETALVFVVQDLDPAQVINTLAGVLGPDVIAARPGLVPSS